MYKRQELLHAKEISECLFTGNINNLTEKEIEEVFKGVPEVNYEEKPLLEFLVDNKIVSSKREGREFLSNNAISLNGSVVTEENSMLDGKRKYNIIRRGKKKYYLVKNSKI